MSSGSTKCENAWSTSCAQVVSWLVSTPRSVSHARSSSASSVQSSMRSRASTVRDATPLIGEVDVVPTERHPGRAKGLQRGRPDTVLDTGHRVPVIRVCLVPLEHREFGLMLVGHAFVAEVLADLVHTFEPADDQALQIELRGDPKVEVAVELVRVRDEGLGERTAVDRLQDGRLDLDEALPVQVAADRRDEARADHEVGARLLVHQQVEMPLPVPRLDVGDAVERVGQRPLVAREQLELVDREARLAAAALRRPAGDADDVAEVDVDLAGALRLDEQLDAARAVDEIEEDELPHVAPRHHAAGDAVRPLALAAGLDPVGLGADVGDRRAVGKTLRRIRHGHESRAAQSLRPTGLRDSGVTRL